MEAPKDRLPWTLAHPAPAAPASLPCAPASGQSGRSEPGTYLLCLQPCLLVCPRHTLLALGNNAHQPSVQVTFHGAWPGAGITTWA